MRPADVLEVVHVKVNAVYDLQKELVELIRELAMAEKQILGKLKNPDIPLPEKPEPNLEEEEDVVSSNIMRALISMDSRIKMLESRIANLEKNTDTQRQGETFDIE